MADAWKTVDEFAKSRGVSRRTMYREMADNNLETVKIRNRRLVPPDAQARYDELKQRQSEGG